MTKAQATVFSLIVAVGAGTTWFTFKHLKKEHDILAVDEDGNIQQPVEPVAPTPPPVTPEPKTAPKPATPPEPPKPTAEEMRAELFSEPGKLMSAFADFAKSRNVDAFLDLAGPEAVDAETLPRLVELLENPAYQPPADHPVMPLAKVAGGERWAIRFLPVDDPAAAPDSTPATGAAPATGAVTDADTASASPATAAADPITGSPLASNPPPSPSVKLILPERLITIDLKQPDKAKRLLEISKILVPDPLNFDPNSTSILPPSTDSVTVAHYFAKAVLSGDFKTARALSDPDKITDERVAALMIAIEEGGYALDTDRPLTQTLERDTVSWIIAKVKNANVASEFGLEMSRPDPKEDPSRGWRIDSMSFDKIIQMTSAAGGGGGVAYAPIVKNPQGGDSLVLFFDFDGDELNVRAMRQVEIIASILKTNPARQITINGHADALGLDDYNAKLSARRAAAVKKALTTLGVAVDQVITKGFGETAPLSPNFKADGSDNPSGRSQNRRTEVYLNF